MCRPALVLGVNRIGKHHRLVRKHPAHQLLVMPDEGFLRPPVGLAWKRFRLHVVKPQTMHQLDGARTGIVDAMEAEDDLPDFVGVARRVVPEQRLERGFLIPVQLAFPFRTRRKIHRGETRRAKLPQPDADRVGIKKEGPCHEARRLAVVQEQKGMRTARHQCRGLSLAQDLQKFRSLIRCQEGRRFAHGSAKSTTAHVVVGQPDASTSESWQQKTGRLANPSILRARISWFPE